MRGPVDGWSCEWAAGDAVLDRQDVMDDWMRAQASPLAHVFHRPDLLRIWLETIGRAAGATPALARATSAAGVTARLAAVVAPHGGTMVTRRVLEPAGQDLFGYHDPLFDRPPDPGAIDGFWAAIRRTAPSHDQALFRFVARDVASSQFLQPSADESPVLSFQGASSLDDVLERCSPNHRGDVRRRLRRLRERGAVALHVYGRGEAADAVRHFGERCWPAWVAACRRQRMTLCDRPGFRDYCDRLLGEGVGSGLAQYAALQVDGVDIAWHLGLSDRGRLYWWLPAHDSTWEDWSPGKAALALIIEHLIAAGYGELHFQTGSQAYKLAWRPALPPRRAVAWHADSWRGRAIGAYDALRSPAGA